MSTRTRALFVTSLAAALLRDYIGLSAPEVRNDNRRFAEPVVASPSL